MILLGNFIYGIAVVLQILLNTYFWVVLIYCVLSFVSPDPYNPIVRFISSATEPLLRHIRRVIPPLKAGLDLSPMILCLLIYFLQAFLVSTLIDYSMVIKASARGEMPIQIQP